MRILIVTTALVASLAAAQTTPGELEKLRDRQDRPGLEKTAAELDAAAAKSSNDAGAFYRAALAWSYVAEVATEKGDKGGAQRAAETGMKAADQAVALNPKSGEYYRLQGTLYGQVIPNNPIIGALAYGKRAKDALDKAIELDPKSPKAWIAHGVGYYYLPPNFGGGPDNAIKDYRQAIALDPRSAEAYLWMGIALKRQHQNAQAREALTKALQLDPDRIWAKEQLDKTPAQ
jgi:tetratricopeptide (TPR) repeat protein